MRKKLPNAFRFYLKRALIVATVPYFIYSNYKIYEAYTVVQQRKIDKKKIESGKWNDCYSSKALVRTEVLDYLIIDPGNCIYYRPNLH